MLTKIADGWWIDLSVIQLLIIDYKVKKARWRIQDTDIIFESEDMVAMKKLEEALESFYDCDYEA